MLRLIARCFARCLGALRRLASLHPGVIAVGGVDPIPGLEGTLP